MKNLREEIKKCFGDYLRDGIMANGITNKIETDKQETEIIENISSLIREKNRQGDKDKDIDKPFKVIGDRYPISTFTGETKRELVEFIKHIESQARFDGYLKGREEGINMFNKINKTQIALA